MSKVMSEAMKGFPGFESTPTQMNFWAMQAALRLLSICELPTAEQWTDMQAKLSSLLKEIDAGQAAEAAEQTEVDKLLDKALETYFGGGVQ